MHVWKGYNVANSEDPGETVRKCITTQIAALLVLMKTSQIVIWAESRNDTRQISEAWMLEQRFKLTTHA